MQAPCSLCNHPLLKKTRFRVSPHHTAALEEQGAGRREEAKVTPYLNIDKILNIEY